MEVLKPDNLLKDQLLQVMIDNEWSDMYVTVWTYPSIKIWWEIVRIDDWLEIFTPDDTKDFALSIINEFQHNSLLKL